MKQIEFPNNRMVEGLLRQRSVPPASVNLTTRIMERTLRVGRPSSAINVVQWLQELLADSIPLRPAYVFATVLIVGFAIGFTLAPALIVGDQPSSSQIVLADDGEMP